MLDVYRSWLSVRPEERPKLIITGSSTVSHRQRDHLSAKPGNVNVRHFTKSQGSVTEKNLVREKWPKTVYC